MTKWIPCGSGFIEADVVRWKESVWEKRSRRRNARAVNVGERVVTAEVLREDAEGWVHLVPRACIMSSERLPGRKVPVLPKGENIRRKRRTIERGSRNVFSGAMKAPAPSSPVSSWELDSYQKLTASATDVKPHMAPRLLLWCWR